MPRRKEISEILNLMEKREKIRNIGLVGHIDHGKTTLSDSLLSEAGLLSPDIAGEARVLDYLEEEQERGITMKSTNISLYYEKIIEEKEPFLINLVDTPGHLDFSGKVTRALRLIDGVVVVVDAVEEIISQSETVIKQALQEGVKPVLYINKVDRLIRELKLKDDQIKKKYIRIIDKFNKLVERFAHPPYDQEWKVLPANGSVAFGSALHKWGFTARILEKSEIKFKDIRKRYKKETYTKESYADLPVYLPIHKAILEMIVNHLPNPTDAQAYRIKKIYDGELTNTIGEALLRCDPKGPLVISLSKVQSGKHGLVATGRIFSGECTNKKKVTLLREKSEGVIQRIAIFMGQRREQVDSIPVGNIVAIEGLKEVKSGETLVEPEYASQILPFENVRYVTTPVVTVSIEPDYLRDLEQMKKIIENLLIEDPNLKFEINEENGEFLLSGMGPLHLEVTAHEIEKRGVKVSISEPRAVFKESCRNESSEVTSSILNGEHSITLKVQRLNQKTIKFFKKMDYKSIKPEQKLKQLLSEKTSLSKEEIEQFQICDSDQNILILLKQEQVPEEYREIILEIFEKIHLNGPLCGEKLTEVKVTLTTNNIDKINQEEAFSEISAMFYEAIKKALNEAESILLEPIYHTIIQLPPEYIKNTLSLLPKYFAKIITIDQDREYQALIEILLPVRNSVKFAENIRSITSGKAFWQNEFHSFMEVPAQQAKSIVSNLRFVKGLSW
ncbi:MAG: elongation factor EF-2 [Candidatus Lokiarchaeota archaeon]|nr:elongation factor EF-2 [Candidatus Lokiarchaeota archaeon]MBD3341930.1 elongation factor EF-2 [Candidatus Lokiarchaeota archaeon]